MPKRKRKSKDDVNVKKFKGVSKNGKRFRAEIKIDSKTQYLGMFDTSKEAAEAHDLARIQAGHPTSQLNFLDQVPEDYTPPKKTKYNKTKEDDVKYIGVAKSGKKFFARIYIHQKYQGLGTFDTSKEAAEAHDRAAIQAGHSTSSLNFLDKKYKKGFKRIEKARGSTGYRGVYKRKNKKGKNRFIVQIWIGDKNHYIGTFDTLKEAAIAYDLAAIQAKHPKSDLNFPNMIHMKKKISTKRKKKKIKKLKKRKKRKMKCSNVTNFNGVSKIGKKFRASVSLDGKVKHFGIFTKARNAAMAYDTAIVELSGKSMDELKSLLNFPNGLEEEEEKKKQEEEEEEEGLKDNKVKYKGVIKRGERYQAQITVDGKSQHVGMYDTPKEAAEAHDRGRIRARHPTFKLNFLDQVPKNYKPKKKKLLSTKTRH